jgi:hypothetical protein
MSHVDTIDPLDKNQTAKFHISAVRTLAGISARRYPEKFSGRWTARSVEYLPIVFDAMIDWKTEPSPFRKDARFSEEREIRIVWQPAPNQPLTPFLTEEDPAIANLIRRLS